MRGQSVPAVCPVCEKAFIIPVIRDWLPKLRDRKTGKQMYFCSISCKEKWKEQSNGRSNPTAV